MRERCVLRHSGSLCEHLTDLPTGAEQLTTILCDKERKHPNYADEPYDRLLPEKTAKVKAFAKDWVKKLVERHSAGSSKLNITPLTNPSTATPSPSATPTPATPTPATPGPSDDLVVSFVPKAARALDGDTPPGTPPSKLSLPVLHAL